MKRILKTIFTPRNLAFLLVGIFIFDLVNPVFAYGSGSDTPTGSNDVLQNLGQILSLIIKMLTFIATFIIAVGGELMGTDLIIGDVAENGLKSIWIFTRNITNIGFILILLYLAISNLFAMGDSGGSAWSWTIKDKLPKLIIALIAINGSFLGFKLAIQAVDVGTVAILSVPDTALKENGMKNLKDVLNSDVNDFMSKDETAKEKFYIIFNKMMCEEETYTNVEDAKKHCLMFIDPKKIAELSDDPLTKNILAAFAVHFMHLEQLPGLAADMGKLTQVLDNTLFATLMALMFVIVLVAMFIVMVVRVAALWLFMAFSPLLVAGGIMGFSDGGSGIASKIVTYLIIPLKISAVFALSFIMMSVLGDYTPTVMGAEWLKVGNSLHSVSLFTILWQLMIVVIFWQGAFWALKDTEAQFVVDSMKSGAEQVGGFALKTATVDRPLFKTAGMKEGVGLGMMSNIGGMLGNLRTQNLQEQRKDMRKLIGMNENMQETAESVDKLSASLKSATNNFTQTKKAWSKVKPENFDDVQGKQIAEAATSDTKLQNNLITALKNYRNAQNNQTKRALQKAIAETTNYSSNWNEIGFADSSGGKGTDTANKGTATMTKEIISAFEDVKKNNTTRTVDVSISNGRTVKMIIHNNKVDLDVDEGNAREVFDDSDIQAQLKNLLGDKFELKKVDNTWVVVKKEENSSPNSNSSQGPTQ